MTAWGSSRRMRRQIATDSGSSACRSAPPSWARVWRSNRRRGAGRPFSYGWRSQWTKVSSLTVSDTPTRHRSLRILLADDHVTVRHGLKLLIDAEPDMKVIAEASDGKTAVQLALELKPDVVVMDIS